MIHLRHRSQIHTQHPTVLLKNPAPSPLVIWRRECCLRHGNNVRYLSRNSIDEATTCAVIRLRNGEDIGNQVSVTALRYMNYMNCPAMGSVKTVRFSRFQTLQYNHETQYSYRNSNSASEKTRNKRSPTQSSSSPPLYPLHPPKKQQQHAN